MSKKYNIPVNRPLLHGHESEFLVECISSGWVSSEGPFVEQFETAFSSWIGHDHGVAVSSGTAALEIAIRALEIGPGDEVIMPTHTIMSCAQAVKKAGATPVLIDHEIKYWNMDVTELTKRITEKTKAIMVVHLFGFPVDMSPVIQIAKEQGLFIIEDTAQMVGQQYLGQRCGSFGDVSTYSFYPNKMITTGEGGMCTTSNPEIADRCRYFRNLCFDPGERFHHSEMGWNYRLTNLQAGLGLAQLQRIDEHLARKKKVAKQYRKYLTGNRFFDLQAEFSPFAENLHWVFAILLNETSGLSASDIIERLGELGVGSRPLFYPIHLQPVFENEKFVSDGAFPVAEHLHRMGLYLPSGLGNTDKEIRQTCDALESIFES